MNWIILSILVSIYFSANTVFVQHSTAEQVNLKENCGQQLVTQIQSAVEDLLKNLRKEMNCAHRKQAG